MAKVDLDKEMAKMVGEGCGAKFHPYLLYRENEYLLQVVLRNFSIWEESITNCFDILRDNNPREKQGSFVGFHLWGVREMLHDQGYKKSSISLEHLIKRFSRHYKFSHKKKVFGEYEEKILKIARKHQFVWHLPK